MYYINNKEGETCVICLTSMYAAIRYNSGTHSVNKINNDTNLYIILYIRKDNKSMKCQQSKTCKRNAQQSTRHEN